MYTLEGAKKAVLETIAKRGYKNIEFVILERKQSEFDKYTWFGFRAFINETFNPSWKEERDYTWSRMIEVVGA